MRRDYTAKDVLFDLAVLVLAAAAVMLFTGAARGQGCCPGGSCGVQFGGGISVYAQPPIDGGWRASPPPAAPQPRQARQAPAQGPPWRPSYLVRVGKDNFSFVGSGALVDAERGVVVFASHQLDPADGETGLIVRTSDGMLHQARRGPADPANDVALLLIGRADVRPIETATSVAIGERVVLHGWPQGDGPSQVAGTAAERATLIGHNKGGQLRRTNGGGGAMIVCRFPQRIQPGESGGPIVNASGRLVGVLSGHDGTGCGPEAIAALLAQLDTTVGPPIPLPAPPTPAPEPERPMVEIDWDQVDQHIEQHVEQHAAGQDEKIGQLTAYVAGQTKLNEEIQATMAEHERKFDSQGAAIDSIEARLAALEAAVAAIQTEPLFYTESWMLQRDAAGNITGRVRAEPRTAVLHGATLRYTGDPRPGSPIDSFRVDVEEGAQD